jgi:hypothetical protein
MIWMKQLRFVPTQRASLNLIVTRRAGRRDGSIFLRYSETS